MQATQLKTPITDARGSAFELIAGLVAAAAAALGIAGAAPAVMAAAAVTAAGFALLAQGGTLGARWQHAGRITGHERRETFGLGAEVVGGLAAIIIGVLAFIGVTPHFMLPLAAVILGATMMLGGPTQPQLAGERVTREMMRTSSGLMILAGGLAIGLGFLAFAMTGHVLLLSLVAVFGIGVALGVMGGLLGPRFARYA